MATIKVMAGDIANDKWQLHPAMFGGFRIVRGFQSINLEKLVESVEVLTEEKVKKFAGTAAWGVAGAMLLGPLGAIGGMLVGGNKKEVAFACYLKDGRKFMAITDNKTWQKILSVKFDKS